MPTLKEIKGRIASVKSTLKITAAMKLVSSAKLRKAQKATEAMRPYEAQLQRMLAAVTGASASAGVSGASAAAEAPDGPGMAGGYGASAAPGAGIVPENGTLPTNSADFAGIVPDFGTIPTAIIALASNSSLCGGFNANAIAKVRSLRKPGDTVYSVGRKMADAMRKDGFPSPKDFTALSEHPAYGPCAELVEQLMEEVADGKFSRVVLVYNHFVSTARQVPVAEVLLQAAGEAAPSAEARSESHIGPKSPATPASDPEDFIIEPSRSELLDILRPKTLKLKLYAALLDSAAAEHAARTVAMQTATDNGENLLAELTLQYNKGRQQKITSEILDLAGGQAQE